MVLLWQELKKLTGRGLRIAAIALFGLIFINNSLGSSLILATGSHARLLHLQVLGGVIHIHDSAHEHNHGLDPGLDYGLADPDGQVTLGNQADGQQARSSDGPSALYELLSQVQGVAPGLVLPSDALMNRQIPSNVPPPDTPYLAVPFKPPIS